MLEVSRQTVSKWKKYYRKRTSERFYYGILMCFMAVGLGILVYNGMRNDEYDVKKYNKENHLNVNNDAIAVWSGCIMIVATIIFLISGLIFHAWKICCIVYPISGLLCGIVSLVIGRHETDHEKSIFMKIKKAFG